MSRIRNRFSAEELRAVEAAVEHAETTTSGEIVTYIAGTSDSYHLAAWKAAALGAVFAALAAALLFARLAGWGVWLEAWMVMPPLLGGAVGYLLGRLPSVRRALVEDEIVAERVRRRAAEVFLSEEVFATRDRTGILIFVSLFERRVELLADTGIHERVPSSAWDRVVEDLVDAIRRDDGAGGLVRAVEACGELLARYRVEPRGDDINELADRPRSEVPE